MMPKFDFEKISLSTDRLAAFSDGVFAVVITLLVLDIKVPELNGLPETDLPAKWVELLPKILSYVLSFLIIGVYWVSHHNVFLLFVKRTDRNLLWINLFLLLCVAFVPFSASFLGTYAPNQFVVVLYSANLIVVNLFILLLIAYVTNQPLLRKEGITPELTSFTIRRTLFGPLVYLIAIALSFINPSWSIGCFILVIIVYLLPTYFESWWMVGYRPKS